MRLVRRLRCWNWRRRDAALPSSGFLSLSGASSECIRVTRRGAHFIYSCQIIQQLTGKWLTFLLLLQVGRFFFVLVCFWEKMHVLLYCSNYISSFLLGRKGKLVLF